MGAEQERLKTTGWKKWGPYVSDRQWGTVREDYSANGDAWNYITHDIARSKAYRWGEEGIAGICDRQQYLCFALALWNKKDHIIKERYFGLSNSEGNHGEDVKELYYYLDNTPTHSYMKMLYKYPQQEFPYDQLVLENRKRSRNDPEFELIDTGVFDNDEYFDVYVEYAKQSIDDILIKITIHNRSAVSAPLNVLPTLWFRNTWDWGYDSERPSLSMAAVNAISIQHQELGQMYLTAKDSTEVLFCNNETDTKRFYNYDDQVKYYKDGINEHVVSGAATVNPTKTGTKAAFNYDITVPAQQRVTLTLRLSTSPSKEFEDFEQTFDARLHEADEFYKAIEANYDGGERAAIQRQAYAGMLWTKQFYYYDIHQWLNGDPAEPPPPAQRLTGRNHAWQHFNNGGDIISMPDKWEYPWFAAWDLAFHCIPLANLDMAFTKNQLTLLVRDWYMHPNGQLPAYEWNFEDANPPVHAMVTWKVYQIDKKATGKGDTYFLERIFHKLMLNFTWWVNRKDEAGNNIFEGGFLGLDNIGVFDRNTRFTNGAHLEQVDATSWMAMYALNLMRIAAELAETNKAYADIASKFFEHFIYISAAMSNLGAGGTSGLWDEGESFFYDQLRFADGSAKKLKVRSIVGLIPLFATEVLTDEVIANSPIFGSRMDWFMANRPDLAALVSRWDVRGRTGKHLISLLRGHRMLGILKYMLDEEEFLSPYGIRSVSKYHLANPFSIDIDGNRFSIKYTPAESDIAMFGGNSNWRGPVWIPMNYLIIESLNNFYEYYGNDLQVQCPTGSNKLMNLKEVAKEIYSRISKLFLRDENGRRPADGDNPKFAGDPHFKDYVLFYEYYDGDSGRGLGASHQTGWSGLIANCLYK